MRSTILLVILAAWTAAQEKRNPVFDPIVDEPGLARILVIGDSISIGYTPPVRVLMKGVANVHRIPENAAHSRKGVEKIERWIASDKKWDIIHVNFGLHDLRRESHGLPQIPLADYEANLTKLFARLKQTGAKLVFATTTPVPYAKTNPPRTDLDVIVYNRVAVRVAEAAGVNVLDLYAVALPKLAEIQLPANVHFNTPGSEFLAQAVAGRWRSLLGK